MQYLGCAYTKILFIGFLKSDLAGILYFYFLRLVSLPEAASCFMTLYLDDLTIFN